MIDPYDTIKNQITLADRLIDLDFIDIRISRAFCSDKVSMPESQGLHKLVREKAAELSNKNKSGPNGHRG